MIVPGGEGIRDGFIQINYEIQRIYGWRGSAPRVVNVGEALGDGTGDPIGIALQTIIDNLKGIPCMDMPDWEMGDDDDETAPPHFSEP